MCNIPFHYICRNKYIFNTIGKEDSILHMVQMSRIFPDSKTFVDMKLRNSPNVIDEAYQQLKNEDNSPSKTQIMTFVREHFVMEDQMDDHVPLDWIKRPKLISRIKDQQLAKFASDLNSRWKMLCRKIKKEVQRNPELYSLIYLPHPVIVPGGRFR